MQERTSGSRTMAASIAAIVDVVADVEAYPRWASQFTAARVLERTATGRPLLVEFVMDAGFFKDTFTLRYTFVEDAPRARVHWHLVRANLLHALDGEYRIAADSTGSHVTYEVEVDPGIPVLGALRRKAERVLVATALDDLAAAVETAPEAPTASA